MLILLCLLGGFRNYNALLNSDQYAYLVYGRSLARGGFAVDYPLLDLLRERFPQGTYRPLFYGRRFYSDGEVISILEPGFPLLLAVAIRLGGVPAVFGVNVILLAVFLISYFLVLRGEAPGKALAALGAVFLVLGWDNHIAVSYSLNLMRDIPPLAFSWLGLCLILKSLRPGSRIFPLLILGVAALAFAGLMRLTNLVVIIPPLALYVVISFRRKGWSGWTIVLWAAASAAIIFLVFMPQFLEEVYSSGDPFSFARRALIAFTGFFGESTAIKVHRFTLGNFRNNLPKNCASIYHVISWPGLILLAAGIFAARRRISTWLIMLPIPLIHLLLFSAYGHRARRYRFPIYPFLAYFIAVGAIWIVNRWRSCRPGSPTCPRVILGFSVAVASGVVVIARWIGGSGLDYANIFFIAVILAAVCPAPAASRRPGKSLPGKVFVAGIGLILLPYLFRLVSSSRNFGWSDAQLFRREIEGCVPSGAIVLGHRYLIQNLDFYTHAHGISPGHLSNSLGVDLAGAVMIVEESGRPVFALDNRGFRSMEKPIGYLRRYFDLEPVCRWRSEDLKMGNPYYSGEEWLSLFRIRGHSRKKKVLNLDTPESVDYLVLLDTGFSPARDLREGKSLISVNDLEYPLEPIDGLNYVVIAAEDVTIPETALAMEFDRPLPADLFRGLYPVRNGFRVDLGADTGHDDGLFVIQGLYLDRAHRRHYRVMGPEASVLLPRLVPPGADGWLELRVKNRLPQPYSLKISARPEGKSVSGRTISAGAEWRTIRLPLPPLLPRQGSFMLSISAEPVVTAGEEMEKLAGSVFLEIDWLEIGWREKTPGDPGDG